MSVRPSVRPSGRPAVRPSVRLLTFVFCFTSVITWAINLKLRSLIHTNKSSLQSLGGRFSLGYSDVGESGIPSPPFLSKFVSFRSAGLAATEQNMTRRQFRNATRRLVADWKINNTVEVEQYLDFRYTFWPAPYNDTARRENFTDVSGFQTGSSYMYVCKCFGIYRLKRKSRSMHHSCKDCSVLESVNHLTPWISLVSAYRIWYKTP